MKIAKQNDTMIFIHPKLPDGILVVKIPNKTWVESDFSYVPAYFCPRDTRGTSVRRIVEDDLTWCQFDLEEKGEFNFQIFNKTDQIVISSVWNFEANNDFSINSNEKGWGEMKEFIQWSVGICKLLEEAKDYVD